MKITAKVSNSYQSHEALVSTNGKSSSITITPKATGFGSSVNGAELLLLSLATCYCNDIYREAAKRNIEVRSVEVEAFATFGGEGDPGFNFSYKPTIVSNATPDQLKDLITYTDEIAEIHRTLRRGVDITLME